MNVIRLTEEHFDQCIEMIGLKNKVSGTVPTKKIYVTQTLKKYFEEHENYYSFGTVDSNTVNSWMTICFIENKTRGKYWAITSFYTKNFKKYFSFNNSDYQLLLRHCIDFAENKNYYQFYYGVAKKINNVFSKKWRENTLNKVENYELKDIAVIPANTEPESDLYWGLMGGELKPDDIVIKYRVRKDKI